MSTDAGTEAEVRAILAAMADDETAGAFHDHFLNADPNSVTIVSRERLAAALPMRRRMFAGIGVIGMRLTSVHVMEVDPRHCLARTTWNVEFTDRAPAPLMIESSYLMRRFGGSWRILAYINRHDVAELIAMRREVLAPRVGRSGP